MDFLADTSYKQSQAEVIGQLTAAPVATGSQLVGYSGFSNEAFIREPYSSDLDFGTGEWSAGAWVNIPATMPNSSFPLGSELVTNGTFDVNTSSWSAERANLSVIDGKLRLTRSGSGYGIAYQSRSVTAGKTYIASYEVTPGTSSDNRLMLGPAYGDSGYGYIYGSGQRIFTATSSSLWVHATIFSADGTYADFDNISVKELLPATGIDRSYSSGSRFTVGITYLGRIIASLFDGTTLRETWTSTAYNTGSWLKVDSYYKTDGSLSIAVNGQQVATTGTQTPLLTLNNSNAVLTIGNNFSLNAPFPGSISLLKLSATVPTTEQLQWTYEQEKALFSANALCTLPDSNTVSDLTFDDKTNRLIAVSSANESYWSGLTRVYTEAVTSGGSLGKVVSTSNVHLVSRSTVNPGVDVTLPAYNIKAHLESDRTEATIKPVVVFDFDPVDNSQTAFVLPIGYSAVAVYKAGTELRETISSAKDWSRSFDGFKETITLTTAPGTTNWIQIHAVKE